MMRFKW